MSAIDRRSLMLGGVALAAGARAAPARGEKSPLPRFLREEPRLAKPVTLRFRRDPVSRVLAEIGRQAGVSLRTTVDTADEPAIVWVSDQPSSEVLHQLALLFNYQWRRRGSAPAPAYELYQDLGSKRAEAALLQQDRQRLVAAFTREMDARARLARHPPEELLAELARLLDVDEQFRRLPNEQQIVRSREGSWWEAIAQLSRVRAMADPLARALLLAAMALTPAQWDGLLDDEPIVFSSREEGETWPLPPPVERALRTISPSFSRPGDRPDDRDPAEIQEQRRQMEATMRDRWGRAAGFRVILTLERLKFAANNQFQGWLIVSPRAILPESDVGVRQRDLRLGAAWPEGVEEAAPPISPQTAARDPVLAARRQLRLEPKPAENDAWDEAWLTTILPAVAESYQLNLVADAYRRQAGWSPLLPAFTAEGEIPLYEFLNRYVLTAARPTRDGAFVRLRRKRWYRIRLGEIPERMATEWTDFLRARPRLSLDELAALVTAFRDEQLEENFAAMLEAARLRLPELLDEVLRNPRMFPSSWQPGAREMLRVYGTLPAALKDRLRAGHSLPYAALPPASRGWLRRCLGVVLEDGRPAADVLAAGVLAVRVHDLERTVVANEGEARVQYRIAAGGELRYGHGSQSSSGSLVRDRSLMDAAPASAGPLQAAHLQFRWGEGAEVNTALLLPCVQQLPRREPPAPAGGSHSER
jgi:hypothetical protein